SEVFPAMAQDAASLKQIVSGPLAQGERFAATFGEITGKLKSIMDQLSTELLKNLGNKFRGSVVDSLPSPQSIQETYREVSTYIRRVAMVFPQMAL
ncbi:hypothetical protein, partial [Klebsiella pneumoniae]|uniref:hypothetical protein n=1 Tax=Klebsiella pneumoniae TaxID=573 RepID=UPI003EDEE3FE